jgi:hypothetical protein
VNVRGAKSNPARKPKERLTWNMAAAIPVGSQPDTRSSYTK